MRTLVVMAHYDAFGGVAPHTQRQVQNLAGSAERVVVVSTAPPPADEASAAQVAALTQVKAQGGPVEFVRRPNEGYDFYSYKTGLDLVDDLGSYDLVVVCNDSYVGPLVPFADVVATMRERPVDFWGMTQTLRRGRHVQSFFLGFRGWVVRSQAFTDFWARMTPVSDRAEVITRYEIGLSTALLSAGFECGSYFVEDSRDRRLARRRYLWWAGHAVRRLPRHSRPRAWRTVPFQPPNPVTALADRALDGARLPLVKIDTLRFDPYGLDAGRLLEECERQYPEAFDGVRAFLERTEAAYPRRAGEGAGGGTPPAPLARAIGYAR